MRRCGSVLRFGLALAVVLSAPCAWSATPEQQEKAKGIEAALKEVAELYKAKKFEDAALKLGSAQGDLITLSEAGPAVKNLITGLHGKLASAHRLLSKKGVELPPLWKPGEKPAPGAVGVSFTKEIVPLIVGRCNNCHVNGMRGNFSMATYDALMKGTNDGPVFTPGKSQGSRLMDVLESGDMPRGGSPLSTEEKALIAKWIDQGARFDGKDKAARISDGQPDQPPRPTLSVVQASGGEKSLFSRDIAPVLAGQCTGCHGAQQPRAQLGLDTFSRLLNGGQDGLVITPGKPDESLLIRKIKGTAGARMPLNGTPLSDDVIAKFETWVAEGAKFDGADPNQSVDFIAQVYIATQMSHDELKARRAELAQKNWQLGNPDEAPERAETPNFLLLGNVGQERLTEIGRVAEQQIPKVARLLKAPTDKPLLKGRVTLFVFNKRFDYSEYGQMVEKREIPDQWNGHWRYNVVDAYGCILPPEGEEYSLPGLIGQQLAGAYIDSLGKVPAWFSQGSAWAFGARVDLRDPSIKQLNERVPGILSQSQKPDDFLTGALPPGDTAILNYSFCDMLMGTAGNYSKLLGLVKKGTPFDQAFTMCYGGTPSQVSGVWALRVAKGR